MSPLPPGLDSQLKNLGELLGLLHTDGGFNAGWFSSAETELSDIPKRLPQLLTLLSDLLGPAAPDNPPVFEGAQWYGISNPVDGTPTGVYLVITQPADNVTSGEVGLGTLHTLGYQDFSITTFAYVPVFQLSTTADPSNIAW